jgi:hypothetical protein
MPDPIRKLESRLRSLALQLVREGKDRQAIAAAVRRVIAESGLAASLHAGFEQGILRQAAWVGDRTLGTADRDAATGVLDRTEHQFATMAGRIEQSVVDLVVRAVRADIPRREIEDQLIHQLNKSRRNAATIANTGLAAFDRIDAFRQAREAGVTRFKFVGPPAERPFCRDHLGKTYTRAEIEQMNNGQGLPVATYAGGYNCRHTWQADVSIPANVLPSDRLRSGMVHVPAPPAPGGAAFDSTPGESRYENPGSGGSVRKPDGWKGTRGELVIARRLADHGFTLELQKVTHTSGVTTADARVVGGDDAETWEFERLTPAAGKTTHATYGALRQAKYQAGVVVYYIDNDAALMADIALGVFNAFRRDAGGLLRCVLLMHRDGRIQTVTQENWNVEAQRLEEFPAAG